MLVVGLSRVVGREGLMKVVKKEGVMKMVACQGSFIRNMSYVARARMLDKIKTDAQYCGEQLARGHFLLYHQGRPLLRGAAGDRLEPSWCDHPTALRLAPSLGEASAVLEVSEEGVPRFAASLGEEVEPAMVEEAWASRFTDLRVAMFMTGMEVAHTLSKGWSLLSWHSKTAFCSSCGAPLSRGPAGAGATCPSCRAVSYPPTSPVGIVAVTDPATDSLLLIRQPRYPPGMYSCIAGFLDPGETLEQCARREVAEEVGIEVGEVSYSSSQHWPFPTGSLMVGCRAEALPGQTPDPCPVELEDARWFTREEARAARARIDANPRLRLGRAGGGGRLGASPPVFLAPRGAIAYHLVSAWLDNKH